MQEANIPTGAIFGAYRIIRQLGVGGMGAVYEVEHVRLGVRYALKVYTLHDENADLFRKRFSAEGKILARLNHPNLIRVIDLDVDLKTGLLYYVMDLVLYKDGESRTLSDLEPGGADEEHLLDWFRQLTSALGYIHERGIVHRDIKLNNILLAPGRRVILSDFGISRIFSDNLRTDVGVSRTMTTNTTGALVVGTEGYMAPEVLRGEPATPAADVYALGVVFFKLLTGVWYDKNLEPRSQPTATGSTDAIKLLSNFEYGWKDVLPRMLASDPTKRPIDLAALADQLNGSASAPRAALSRVSCAWSYSITMDRPQPSRIRFSDTRPVRSPALIVNREPNERPVRPSSECDSASFQRHRRSAMRRVFVCQREAPPSPQCPSPQHVTRRLDLTPSGGRTSRQRRGFAITSFDNLE